jgi:ATP-dependent RNA helicase SUPV3L1/SUV3
LDQDARASLRKHGVRFGQFTIFVPALLKPAPTRLRLVLWSLWQGLDEFPESPPPGLVTIPHMPAIPTAHYLLGGYRPAGARAIRIDMLERLADLLRAKDSRAGFEATADMLSITGLTLEQFADLMEGLGYRAERAERPKQRPATEEAQTEPTPPVSDADAPAGADLEAANAPAPAEGAAATGLPDDSLADTANPPPAEGAEAPADTTAEVEVFFTFTWAPRPRPRRPRDAGQEGDRGRERSGPRQGKPRGNRPAAQPADATAPAPADGAASDREPARPRPAGQSDTAGRPAHGGNRPPRQGKPGKHGKPEGPRQHQAAPPSRKEAVDPDNPFAVLAALRDRI